MQRNFMASPFAAQLRTNYCPKDNEVLEIQTLLIKSALQLKNLDNEIAKLQKAIEKLMEERDGLGAYVDAHKALISPARRLPLDIIEEIFVASWRAISLSTPRLWAKIHVVEPQSDPYSRLTAPFDEKVAQRVQVTKMWLGRSGQCPLSISLESAPQNSRYDTEVSPAASVQFLQALIPFAPRWQHIHFTTPSSYILEIISHLDIDMPWLETAAFHHQMSRSLHSIDWGHFSIFRGARISTVSIPGDIFIPERFPVFWDQLTTLTIGGPSWSVPVELTSEVIFRVISGCPELRCCKVVVCDNPAEMSTAPPQHPILELPFLHTLAIHCVGHAAPVVSLLLKRLSVPELSNFTFLGDGHHYISDAAVLRFITARMMLEPRALKSVEIYFGRPMTTDIMPNLRAFIETGLAISLSYTTSPRYSPWKGLPDAPAVAYPTWTPPNRPVWLLAAQRSREGNVSTHWTRKYRMHVTPDPQAILLRLNSIHVQVVGPVVKTFSSAATVERSRWRLKHCHPPVWHFTRGQLEFQFEQCTIWKLMTSDFDFALALLRAAKTKLAPD
ncbi:hypothetical protein B0H14DRAFT_3129596 [Mycena olivaceomarginata]|nr:hypothetical protein B0H14DRAFT_3129596 [Mycena olivaceomarginata]